GVGEGEGGVDWAVGEGSGGVEGVDGGGVRRLPPGAGGRMEAAFGRGREALRKKAGKTEKSNIWQAKELNTIPYIHFNNRSPVA
ncbi:MAG: hypothetical protein KDD10_29130, partial [Phaeodactylibacter sp.]|nr:hypothetical protein [Phaeodactylibacter sp.]